MPFRSWRASLDVIPFAFVTSAKWVVQKQKELHGTPPQILSESQLTKTLGGVFENSRIQLPDRTCEVSGSEATIILIETAADLNLGGGFEMGLHGAVLQLVKELIFCLTLTRLWGSVRFRSRAMYTEYILGMYVRLRLRMRLDKVWRNLNGWTIYFVNLYFKLWNSLNCKFQTNSDQHFHVISKQ